MSYWTASVVGPYRRLSAELRLLLALVAFEVLALVGYFALTDATVTNPRYVLYPFVWINVGAVAVLRTTPASATRHVRLVAATVAVLYFLALAALAGLVGLELGAHTHSHVHGFQFTMAAPGWGPRVGYAGSLVTVNFVPYRVLGYLALSYLVYATLVDAAAAVLSGVLGLASCIGCSFPIAGSLAAGAVGGTGVVALETLSIDISTLVFVGAVALLAVRPRLRRPTTHRS
ncbi:hypothetical protein AUR64_07000 [Haloprofundus marisrubri]|uniref:Uncharacterized protein n=1 Tax=Haloprofundus marisrubri TaxID=1514971 RepID=A0A0W1RC32_9EURY|nr:hypothetical protein [Haloprofundus marisrubri]KTG10918.1 hypothetical protein AUR64_07000 [Haloprofundus marisrubri]